jgi:hypothetical protein
MSGQAWGLVFLMLILKIPIVYLGIVVWYACKEPEQGAGPNDYSVWRPWRTPQGPRPRRGGPHGHRDGRARAARRDRVPS